jgi:hypothetical protein
VTAEQKAVKVGGMLTLQLTNKQYLALLRATYLGRWVAVGDRPNAPDDADREEFASLERYLLAHATEAGYARLVAKDADGRLQPSPRLDTQVDELIDACIDEIFWEELTQRLAERDLESKYPQKELEELDDDEFEDVRQNAEKSWRDEFDAHGLERLDVK